MLEILLLALVAVTLLAKNYGKKSYHRNYRLRKVRIATSIAIGALAGADVVAVAMTAAGTGTYRVISLRLAWSIVNHAAPADGAYEFGVAHSDYSAAEIEECLEASASIDPGDKIANEQANRLVRSIGTISSSSAGTASGELNWNDGRPMKTRLNWLMTIGDTLTAWVRNGSGTIYTTGSSLGFVGEMWVKDSV